MSPKLLNILLVAIPAVLYYGYLNPAYTGDPGLIWTPESSIFVLQSQNIQYTNAFDQVSLVEKEIEKINKDYLSVDSKVKDKALLLLPDSVDPIKLRSEVVSIANDAGVAISGLTVTVNGRQQAKEVGSYLVSFSTRSHYSVFKKMIEGFDKSTRFFVLESVSIQRPDSKEAGVAVIDDGETLNCLVTFRVYYLK